MRTNNFNYEILEDLVGTNYGDMTGLIQIDGHMSLSELYNLCEENGIDKDKYFLIGFGFSDFTTNGVGSHMEKLIVLYCFLKLQNMPVHLMRLKIN